MKKHLVIIIGLFFSIVLLQAQNGSFTDIRDGNVYRFVTIGNQVWMAENLKYLPEVVSFETGSKTDPYYYVYDYDGTVIEDAKATTNYNTYGVLYNWPAAMAGSESSTANPSGVQGVCPAGWHLASEAEWTTLTTYLGGESVTGGKLKETGTSHWITPNTGANNETGFTALPGGYRNNYNAFYLIGHNGFWWTSEGYSYVAWNRYNYFINSSASGKRQHKEDAFSVRCIRD